jgi:HlyD family secretion protein
VLNAQANVGAANAAVSRARLDADNAQRDRLRKQELLDKQFVSQADFENSRNLAGTLAEALKVSLAQLEVARAQVVAAKAVVRQREAALSQARFDLDRTEIRSPVDGVVIKRSVDVGQTVAASLQAPELFIIARDLSDMQVEAAIDEADIARVRIDQKVTFTIDAFAGRSFEGRVGQIRKAAVSAQNVVTYTVVVAFANPNAAVLPGMTANVRIVTEVRDNVLKVPNAALRVRLPGIEPVDLVASAPRDAAAGASAGASAASAAALAASQPSQPQRAAGIDGGGRAPTRGRIHILGPDGKPRAFFVRLGVSDGLATELLIGAGTALQPDADLIKEGAEVVISAGKPAGGPTAAARTGPGGAPRAPF